MEKNKTLKNFWEQCHNGLVQINLSDKNKKILIDRFNHYVLPRVDLHHKSIIDYGVGGGYFGELILNTFNIKKYNGIDISERSIKNAEEKIKKYKDIISFDLVPDSFKHYNADVFFCFACIQHFITKEYLDDFLNKVNTSNIPEIFLQIRVSKNPKFLNSLNKNENLVYYGCTLPYTYIVTELNNYDLDYKSNIINKGNYQYLKFLKR